MPVLGFDPSLVSSGFAYVDAEGQYRTGRIRTGPLRGAERLDFIERSVVTIFDGIPDLVLVAYEGYAMGGKTARGRLFDIGELGGVLKLLAWRRGVEVLLVPPTNLKQFATGSGRADKAAVIAAIARTWGYNVPCDDEADAFVLLKMGQAYMAPRRPRSAIKAKALLGCSR